MTAYWTLEEALGVSERTVRRWLVEDGHAWSEAVKHFVDVRPCYGTLLAGADAKGDDVTRPAIVGTVIRFFPKGRLSEGARVKKWGRRDLLADSLEGLTRPARTQAGRRRYKRAEALMSAYSSITEQLKQHNWLLVTLGQTVTNRASREKTSGSVYADIPDNVVLNALREDLSLAVSRAKARGANVKWTRSVWVNAAAKVLAERFGDASPLPRHAKAGFVTHHDGFTDLWRRALWTAVRAELYGRTGFGWNLVQRLISLSLEARGEGKRKPTAWAWAAVKREGFAELLRDYATGAVGEVIPA